MARARSPNRDKALQIFLNHKGDITNRAIAEQLDEKEKTISNWKSRDQWNVVLQKGECSTTNKVVSKKGGTNGGAPKGNKNALGNSGGPPKQNSNAVTHGFFRKIFPDDDEIHDILNDIMDKSPVDIIWENIQIQYMAIIRSQKIMYVRDQYDMTKELKRKKESDTMLEKEYELQFAWDKQAKFLQAQSRAQSELRSLIKQFDEMAHKDDERRLKLEQMRLGIEKTKAEIENMSDDKDEGPIEIVIKRKGKGEGA